MARRAPGGGPAWLPTLAVGEGLQVTLPLPWPRVFRVRVDPHYWNATDCSLGLLQSEGGTRTHISEKKS